MSEERFRVAYENYGAWDKVLCKKLSYEELVDLLNSLTEENRDLKLEMRWRIEKDEYYVKLKEENEMLKKKLNEMIALFSESGVDYHISDELEDCL